MKNPKINVRNTSMGRIKN